jgi:hypothetical protein
MAPRPIVLLVAFVFVLALPRRGRSDVSAPTAPPAQADEVSVPATDGRWLAWEQLDLGNELIIRVVELRTGNKRELRIRYDSDVPGSREEGVRRALGGYHSLVEEVMLDRSRDPQRAITVASQKFRVDRAGRMLTLDGRLRRKLDLTIRDTCLGEPRSRLPEWLTVWASADRAVDVVMMEYYSAAGSCMCEDEHVVRVVTRERTLEL